MTYTWTFEAGPTLKGQTAFYIYEFKGKYTIKLTVKDGGDSASDTLTEVVPQ